MPTLPPPGAPHVLWVVDLSGYVFRAYHAIAPLSNVKGEVTHAALGTTNMIQKIVSEKVPAMLAVAMDSSTPSFRKKIDDRYKANRPVAPADLKTQMARCREIAIAYGIPVYEKAGVEADDLIACLVAKATKAGARVIICAADKDLLQLVHDDDEQVLMWDSMRDKVFGPKEVEEKFGVAPSKVRDVLAFMGDTSDNIPGVPGVGPKTAAELIRKWGSLEGVYAHAAELGKGKVMEAVRANEKDARISLELVSLKEDLEVEYDEEKLQYGGANEEKLIELFTELEFTRLLGGRMVSKTGGASSTSSSASGAALIEKRAPAPIANVDRGTPRYETITSEEALAKIVDRARKQGEIAIAVATTATDDAMRAHPIGVALSDGPGHGVYVPLSHRYLGAPSSLSLDDMKRIVGPILADAKIAKVGHDLKRTIIVLEQHGFRVEGAVFDPMVASYLLDPEGEHALAAIAKREFSVDLQKYEGDVKRGKTPAVPFDELDVERATELTAPIAELALSSTKRLAPRLAHDGLAPLMSDIEMPLLRVLVEMERTGVLVDTEQLLRASKQAEEKLTELEAKAKTILGHDFMIRSRDQLESILFDELGLPVLKRTPKGGRSTDASVLEELAADHELPNVILEFRELDKLRGTYLEALPRAKNDKTGRIHTRFDQAVAATGRLSSNDPNLQNIPIRTEIGKSIRAAFIAQPGSRLVSADYSQIELRVLAHLSKDAHLVDAFTRDIDIHVHTASVIFEIDPKDVTKQQRGQAKTINFGVIYGMGEARLARSLGMTRQEASRFIAEYFKRYSGVRRFMADTIDHARRGEAVRTMLGRRRFLPNLHSANRALRMEAERIAKNTPIQGTAADIIKLAMVSLGTKPPSKGSRMILSVHDELLFEVPEAELVEAKENIVRGMRDALKLDVPLVVDIGDGHTWGEAH